MGVMIATCGHRIGLTWFLSGKCDIATKTHVYDDDGARQAVNYQTVCSRCRRWYARNQLILRTKEQQDRWMRG